VWNLSGIPKKSFYTICSTSSLDEYDKIYSYNGSIIGNSSTISTG